MTPVAITGGASSPGRLTLTDTRLPTIFQDGTGQIDIDRQRVAEDRFAAVPSCLAGSDERPHCLPVSAQRPNLCDFSPAIRNDNTLTLVRERHVATQVRLEIRDPYDGRHACPSQDGRLSQF